jgi:hypothetical protein
MFHHSKRAAVESTRLVLATAVASLVLTGSAFAQENQAGPPAALQFPSEAGAGDFGEVGMRTVRQAIENTVDVLLCKTLMRRDGRPIPEPFTMQNCEPGYAQRVASNSGDVSWASASARPTLCGQNCFGRPAMTQQDNRTRPNLRRARLFAWVQLRAGPREISYPLDVFFTCSAANGARDGTMVIEAKAGPPAIGEAGVLESLGNFFTAGYLSSYIESELRRQLPAVLPQSENVGACRSVGPALNSSPAFDAVRFNLPASGRRITSAAAAAAITDRVRIEFLRIVRNPLPPLIAQEHGSPGDPISGQFTVFLNGASRFLTPQGLVLPVTGGSAPLNLCTTVDVTGWDRLQLLFTNDLGGAAWSQFTSSSGYGQGGVRTLTTSRTIVVPASGAPDPVTGRPRPARPQPVVLSEFELTYRITFIGRPTVATQDAAPTRGQVRPGLGGAVAARPSLSVDPAVTLSTPCREI